MDEEDDKDGNVEHGEDLPVNKFVDVLLGNARYEVMPRWGVSFVRDGDIEGGGTYQERGGEVFPQQVSEEGSNLGQGLLCIWFKMSTVSSDPRFWAKLCRPE